MPCRRCASTSRRRTATRTCRTSRTSTNRARAPGSSRGDSPDRPDVFAANGAAVAGRREQLQALLADLSTSSCARQMTPAIVAVTAVEVDGRPRACSGPGSVEKFDGWRRVLPPAQAGRQSAAAVDRKAGARQARSDGQPALHAAAAALQRSVAREDARKRRASAGRAPTPPSSRTIQKRGYVKQEQRRFFATEIGKVVTDCWSSTSRT